QRVADEQLARCLVAAPNRQAHAAGTMARRMPRLYDVPAKRQADITVEESIDRRLALDLEPEHLSLFDDAVVEKQVLAVQPDWHAERGFRAAHAGDVVEVRVRQQNRLDVGCRTPDDAKELIDLVT